MFLTNVLMVLWLSIPLVLANCLPVFAKGWSTEPLKPIDRGRLWFDGQPIFGPHKTQEGFVWSVFFATGIGWILAMLALACGWNVLAEAWGEGFWAPLRRIFCMALGTLTGDLIKSFFKRRRGQASGAAWPVVDQFDAVVGAYGLTWIVERGLFRSSWFEVQLLPGRWLAVGFLCFVYFAAHRGLSSWAFRAKLKSAAH